MIWGIDLGVRSLSLAGLDEDELTIRSITESHPHNVRYSEVRTLAVAAATLVSEADVVFVEEPPLAGSRNIRTFLKLSELLGGLMAALPCPVHPVPVSTWKKEVAGKGSLSKDDVSLFLKQSHPGYSALCAGDQNLIDATCIALYGQQVLNRALAWSLLDPQDKLDVR